MLFPLCKWYFYISWHKFEKRWADVFQIYPNAVHLNPLQFCPSMSLLGFPVFCLSSSIVLNRYFHILGTSMTIWLALKLRKIAWPGPLKIQPNTTDLSTRLWENKLHKVCREPRTEVYCFMLNINIFISLLHQPFGEWNLKEFT